MRGLLALLLLLAGQVLAGEHWSEPKRFASIAIVIDDMGNDLALGQKAVALPGKVSYSFLPHTPYASRLSRQAHEVARESLLHLPMQSRTDKRLGSGALMLDMDEQEMAKVLQENLNAVPFVVGINNHMGSLITTDSKAMERLMRQVRLTGNLFFLDSRTHDRTVAEQVARAQGIPTTRRNVFLDNVRDPASIRKQFNLLIATARQNGTAVAIGHPYPETLAALKDLIPSLDAAGIELVPMSDLIRQQELAGSRLSRADNEQSHY